MTRRGDAEVTPTLTEPLLTAKEVAALLRVDVSQVYRLRHSGLPCYKIGGAVRFSRQAVESWLEKQQDGEIRVKLTDVSL